MMSLLKRSCLISILTSLVVFTSTTIANGTPEPPVAKKVPKKLTIHDHTRVDNYYWLNERENQDVLDYLTAENDYLDGVMAHTKPLQEALFQEIKGRLKPDDASVPYLKNGYYYYVRYEPEKEYPIYCRKKGRLEAAEEVMLDVNQMAEGYSYYRAAGLNISPDSRYLAFGVDTVSRRQYTIHVKDLKTGDMLDDAVPNTTAGSEWANDSKTIFYTTKDSTLRPHMVWRHTIGEPTSKDAMIFHEKDNTFSVYLDKTRTGKYISIESYSTLSTEMAVIDADNPRQPQRIIQPREADHEYYFDHKGDDFYIVTNLDARNFRLMKTPVDKTGKENWTEVIAHRDDVRLQGVQLFKDFMVVQERKAGLRQLRIVFDKGGSEHYLDFGEAAYVAYPTSNYEYDTKTLRYGYSSMTTPQSTYDYDVKTRKKTLLKESEVIGDFDRSNYESERVFVKARDGAEIPVSIVYRKGMEKNGSQPLLLYGYGSYGASMEATFSISRLSLLDRGFVYAIAHIRGGEEMGRQWYEDGKLLRKKNTFTDFIDCAEYLIAEKYTSQDRIFARGGSAGGLLMGAVVNMRPDLFKGVVAAVPFVDVITTMLDETIPLTTGEYDEWGNPNDPEYYKYILSYSPYDNVEAKDYPAMLITTGLHDSQVQYWEPAKWVAKLRELKTDNNMLLFQTEMEAGHGGASGRYTRIRSTALQYAFMLNLLNRGTL